MVTTGLIAPTAVVVASSTAPASAATATRVVSAYSNQPFIYSSAKRASFRDNLYVGALVVDANGARVYEGTTTLQRRLAGQSSWSNVATSSGTSVFQTLRAAKNATYRVVYNGTSNYTASSAQRTIKVQRGVTTKNITGKRAGFKGKITPKAKTKIIIKRKVGKKWRPFRTQRTKPNGRFTIVLPAPSRKKTHWQITFKGSKGFAPSTLVGWTRRY